MLIFLLVTLGVGSTLVSCAPYDTPVFAGASEASDPSGDAMFLADDGPILAEDVGLKPTDDAGDLVSVSLLAEADRLLVTFRSAGDLGAANQLGGGLWRGPRQLVEIDWSLTLRKGSRMWLVSAVTIEGWQATVSDSTGGSTTLEDEPSLDETHKDRLLVPVPLSDLAGLEPPFEWFAISYWTIGGEKYLDEYSIFIDAVPGTRPDQSGYAQEWLSFPQ
ncbi:MAG: hypothetical protein M5U22_07090 [Thermoleophilia bacterium]|nr:hypothetical protein [Thermoleophilia bacterium]